MAEDQDREDNTEEPTEKRISDAIEKGNVPLARDATLFGSIAGILAGLIVLGKWTVTELSTALQIALSNVGVMRLEDREAAALYLVRLLRDLSIVILPMMGVFAAGSLLASLMQNVPTAAGNRVTPQLSRLSPVAGWNRLFGNAGLLEFAKSTARILLVTALLWWLFKRDLPTIISSLGTEPGSLLSQLQDLAAGCILPLLVLALVLAIVDLVWSRIRWRRELRMSRNDIKEEMKEAEGDPFLRSRIRSIARQRLSRRMLQKLPQASMVITNPTHYAVALRYVREEGGAPVVIAKGVDHLALKIREIASQHGVPMVENRPLARSLHDQVEVDSQIPPEFYRAVAEIIHYLNSTGRFPRGTRPLQPSKSGTSLMS